MPNLGPEDIRWIVQALIILVLSICVHEFGHAIVADKLGDRLPRSQGRTTLNPLAHADPIGTIVFPLLGLVAAGVPGFGWGRPVMVNPISFDRRFKMRTAHMFVAAAGPVMNILFALVLLAVHTTLMKLGKLEPAYGFAMPPTSISQLMFYAVYLNIILAFFNLIPAKPLDGGTILEGLIPDKWVPSFERFSIYGPFVLMGVILIPGAARIFLIPARFVTYGLYSIVS